VGLVLKRCGVEGRWLIGSRRAIAGHAHR
jgi:hypothetical protein